MPNPVTRHIETLLPPNSDTNSVLITFGISAIPIGYPDAGTAQLTLIASGSETLFRPPAPTQIHFNGASTGTIGPFSVSTAGAAVGDLVTVVVASKQPVASVTDDKGNTYTVDNTVSNTQVISIASSILTTALVAGTDGINITMAGFTDLVVDVWKWTGAIWTGPDQVGNASGASGASGAMHSGSVVPLQDNEMVLAAFSSGGTISGGNGTVLEAGHSSGAGTPSFIGVKWLFSYVPSTQEISGVTGDASNWAGATVSYKVYVPITLADGGPVPLIFSVSGIEIPSTDKATIIVGLTPSGSDTYVPAGSYVDGTVKYLRLIPSATEEAPPVAYTESGTIYLNLDFAADDCFAILTPHWHTNIRKRWTCVAENRWQVAAVHTRWTVWVIGVAVDNPCPEPILF